MFVAAELGFAVGDDLLAVDQVFDEVVAADFHLDGDPLFAVEGFGFGQDAVIFDELVIDHDVGAGGAKIASGAWVLAISCEDLDFEGSGEILFEFHGGWWFAVDHDAAIAQCPSGAAINLLAGEAVFEAEAVVGEFFFEKQVTEAVVPLFVF